MALLTADTYRIAAAEQLRTYANILDTPFYPLSIHRKILEKRSKNLQIMIWYWWIPQDFHTRMMGRERI